MTQDQTSKHCPRCKGLQLHARRGTNHLLHFFITLCFCGFWLPVWILSSFKVGGWRCQKCGSKAKSPLFAIVVILALLGAGLFALMFANSFMSGVRESFESGK